MIKRPLLVLIVVAATGFLAVGTGWLAVSSTPSQRSAHNPHQEERLTEREEARRLAAALREEAEKEGEREGGKLRAPLDDVVCCNRESAYDSTNIDGQAGSGDGATAYHPGGESAREVPRPDARLFRTGFGAWEPTLGVAPNGAIFYAGRNSNVDPVALRSRDDGRTWKAVPPAAHRVSLDPYLWVDPSTGRVFTSDLDPTVTCSPLSFSDDEGKTWTTTSVCGETDHQNVFGGPPPDGDERPSGYPNVVYYCAISGGALASTSTATACSKSLDGGKTFLPTGKPAYPPRVANGTFCDGAAGHGVVGPDGTVYLPRAWGEQCREPYLAISDDEGKTWTRAQVSEKLLPEGAHEAGVAVDKQGHVYYSWVGKDHHPYLAVSRDGGKTWTEPLDILPPGVSHVSAFTASIDAGRRGAIAAVFTGTEDPPATPTEDTTWNGYIITSASVLHERPTFYATSVNDPLTNPLWKGSCGDVRCGNTGDFFDVVIGPDGTPWAALVDSCPGKENRCTDFAITTPRGEGIVGHVMGGPRLR